MIASLLLALGCADIQVDFVEESDVVDPMYGRNGSGHDTADWEGDGGPGPSVDIELGYRDTASLPGEAVQRWQWTPRAPQRLHAFQGAAAGELMLADLGGDGIPEVLLFRGQGGGTTAELAIWPGTPVGPGPATVLPLGTGYQDALAADVTGDGHVDLILSATDRVDLLAGDGVGFGPAVTVDSALGFGLVGTVDLTGDGVDELVASVPGEWEDLRVYTASSQGGLESLGTVSLTGVMQPPHGLSSLKLAGERAPLAVLAETRPDSEAARVLRWDRGHASLSLEELGEVRDGLPGSPMLAAFEEDLDGDGQNELVSSGLTGLYTWNPVDGGVTEVRPAASSREQGLGLVRVDLEGDGSADALEYLAAEPGAGSAAFLQPSLAWQGRLEVQVPSETGLRPASPLGRALVAARLDEDDCADVVLLDAGFQPWLFSGFCRPVAP